MAQNTESILVQFCNLKKKGKLKSINLTMDNIIPRTSLKTQKFHFQSYL